MNKNKLQEIEDGLHGAEWLDKETTLQLISEIRRLKIVLQMIENEDFTIKCNKCGSYRCYVETDFIYITIDCAECSHKKIVYELD